MPGILPMKVIKVGNSSQSRIAQACDRCRSKKIRCDGIRPCCTQCANVGFECRTSDKLSRRAFPRGYTESLEDRVRTLEAEVRELKGLLSRRDETIDVLSQVCSPGGPVDRDPSSQSASPSEESKRDTYNVETHLLVFHPSFLPRMPTFDAPFSGPSSMCTFVDTLTGRLKERGKHPLGLSAHVLRPLPPIASHCDEQRSKTPPRLVSDQLINVFFQEWAPLYPVVHQQTILQAYNHYLADVESLEADKHDIIQLNLIFGIAAASAKCSVSQNPAFFELLWYPALELLSDDVSVQAVQCYILAQMYYMLRGNYKSLSRYRGLAVSLCHQLGLHRSQQHFSLDPMSSETRKKVFWCQYVLDRFTATITGLPVLMRDADIDTEYPTDIDDEYVIETGFPSALPGDSDHISCALALFRASRILGKVVDQLYLPTSPEISLTKPRDFMDELDAWFETLPPYLKLEFAQDKLSSNMTSSRSPLLSMVYHFIRTLIHRPVACFGRPSIASPSIIALSDSSGYIIKILQLLDERRMSLSLCMNRADIVLLSGLGLLWQTMDLKCGSILIKENQKLLLAVVRQLESESATAATEFSLLVNHLTCIDNSRCETSCVLPNQRGIPGLPAKSNSPKKQLQSLKSRILPSAQPSRHAKTPPCYDPTFVSSSSVINSKHHAVSSSRIGQLSQPNPAQTTHFTLERHRSTDFSDDYTLNYTPSHDHAKVISCSNLHRAITENWELLPNDIDRGNANIFNSIYGGECGDNQGYTTLIAEYQQLQQSPSHLTIPLEGETQEISSSWSTNSCRPSQSLETPAQGAHCSERNPEEVKGVLSAANDMATCPNDSNCQDPLDGFMHPIVDDVGDFGRFNILDQRIGAG